VAFQCADNVVIVGAAGRQINEPRLGFIGCDDYLVRPTDNVVNRYQTHLNAFENV
jgi:hypothetical protein